MLSNICPFWRQEISLVHCVSKIRKSWDNYCKSHKCPTEIPSYPDRIYRFCGWKGYGDWLGTRRASKRKLRSFQEAREFVRSLGIKTTNEWYSLCKNGELPNDIPSCPRSAYLHTGWVNFGDWLGTGTLANQDKKFRNFDKARNFCSFIKFVFRVSLAHLFEIWE